MRPLFKAFFIKVFEMSNFVCHFQTDQSLDDFDRKERLTAIAAACCLNLSASWAPDSSGLMAATFSARDGMSSPSLNQLEPLMKSKSRRYGLALQAIRAEA